MSVASDLFQIELTWEHDLVLPSVRLSHKCFLSLKKMGGILAGCVWGRVVQDSICRGLSFLHFSVLQSVLLLLSIDMPTSFALEVDCLECSS